MQNINYVGGAGSTTAAQFLQKIYFKQNSVGSFRYCWYGFFKVWGFELRGTTGFGVRLLNKLIEENYE